MRIRSFILLTLLLTACSVNAPAPERAAPSSTIEAPPPVVSAVTIMPIATRTATTRPTLVYGRTRVPAEAMDDALRLVSGTGEVPPSVTPKPTRTSTPTPFVAKDVCMKKAEYPVPTTIYHRLTEALLSVDDDYLLNYLNAYGVEAMMAADRNSYYTYGYQNNHIEAWEDLTNDGLPELVYSYGNFWILGCGKGRYEILFKLPMNPQMNHMDIVKLTDINQNSYPEILVDIGHDSWGISGYQVFEWDGGAFEQIIVPEGVAANDEKIAEYAIQVHSEGYFDFEDLDRDGMDEYVLYDALPISLEEREYDLPGRKQTSYYKWNGSRFVFYRKYFSTPEYRFQAVQDADRAILYGEYERARKLYQQTIFDEGLKWWTYERRNYEAKMLYWNRDWQHNQRFETKVPMDPLPTHPAPDPLERDYLEAYARFRLIVLYALQSRDKEAQTVYEALYQKYSMNGAPGYVYAKMANVFWSEYTASKDISMACGKAIQSTETYGELATQYIGNQRMHGFLSEDYTPKDLCPFTE